jgi:hypothetical protein
MSLTEAEWQELLDTVQVILALAPMTGRDYMVKKQ